MNIFIDTEFTCLPGDQSSSEIISIGVYCENGEQFYECLSDFNQNNLSPFVEVHVIPLLPNTRLRKPKDVIGSELSTFLAGKDVSAVWAVFPTMAQMKSLFEGEDDIESLYEKYADWDFQLLVDLINPVPNGFPSYCHDLTPLYQSLDAENVPKNESTHDALEDAIWNYKVWALAKGK
jgi:hypothetical protein